MKKKLTLILISVISTFMFISCGNAPLKDDNSGVQEASEIKFVVPDGLPAI